ncbi:hypothetical protein FB446DRAFT_787420 [Lentinula raphanica]|nr:hypothetical protein FB446DRAFT_787420 [Lentinula raphanica]
MRLSTTFNKSLSLSFSAVVILSIISSQLHLVSAAPAPVVPVPAPTPVAPAPFPEQVQAIRTTAPQAQDQAGGVTGVAAGFSLVERDNHDGDDDVAGFRLNLRDIRYDVDGVGGRGGVGGNTVGLGGGGGSFGQPKPSPKNLQAGSLTSESGTSSPSAIKIHPIFAGTTSKGTGRSTTAEEKQLINNKIGGKISHLLSLSQSLQSNAPASVAKPSVKIIGTCSWFDPVPFRKGEVSAGENAPKDVSYSFYLKELCPGKLYCEGFLSLDPHGKHVIRDGNGKVVEAVLEAKIEAQKADKKKKASKLR